jgi:predicted metal-dependent phosphoesterase TrpH
MTVDLHLHTHHSDGTWSPQDLIEYAVKLKLQHIAVTDHDTTAGIDEALQAAAGRLEIIPGVEINTILCDSEGKRKDIHILGYHIDRHNQTLAALLARQRQARLDHVQAVIDRLADANMRLSWETIHEFSGAGAIGKAHITKAIVASGFARDIVEAYEKYMSGKSPFFVARESVSPVEAIAAINAAGGIASLAHPGKGEAVFALLTDLQQKGLRAVEAYHRMHSVQVIRRLIRFANKNQLLITGGSDCHGPYEDCPPSVGSISVPVEVVDRLKAAARKDAPACQL